MKITRDIIKTALMNAYNISLFTKSSSYSKPYSQTYFLRGAVQRHNESLEDGGEKIVLGSRYEYYFAIPSSCPYDPKYLKLYKPAQNAYVVNQSRTLPEGKRVFIEAYIEKLYQTACSSYRHNREEFVSEIKPILLEYLYKELPRC